MKYADTSEQARWKQRRHRCDECRRIFDCPRCPHRGNRLTRVFCSEVCEEKSRQARRDLTLEQDSNVFTRYLKRAGLG
jgi:hypothetical protein